MCIVGEMVPPTVGDQLALMGKWFDHPQFGRQSKVQTCSIVPPNTTKGIKVAFSSGRVRGIGPKLAERIVEASGMDTFKVIAEDPEKLKTVPGIGQGKGQKICDGYRENNKPPFN